MVIYCVFTLGGDAGLADDEVVGVHPCDNTASVFLRCADLKALIKAHGNPVGLLTIPVCSILKI